MWVVRLARQRRENVGAWALRWWWLILKFEVLFFISFFPGLWDCPGFPCYGSGYTGSLE